MLQYDDIVLQVIDRLKVVFPQTGPSPIVVKIAPAMENAQKEIENFFLSVEQSKILVTYSGNEVEGGRQVSDWIKTLGETSQFLSHTIEVHICSKKYMGITVGNPVNSMLKLMWGARVGLQGLYMYERDNTGAVKLNDALARASASGMFFVETLIDRNYVGGIVATVRFQLMEMTAQDSLISAEAIWGQYKEITFEEYAQQDGTTPSTEGSPTSVETTVPVPVPEEE